MPRQLPNLLLIGATERDVGKTEFACRLIARLKTAGPVVGVKVTPVDDGAAHPDTCPRGGGGCGACATLTGDYAIEEEAVSGASKDTQRLLAAGAAPVFWLRSRRASLDAAAGALAARLPDDVPVVCESNSLRAVIEPGAFLLLRRQNGAAGKPTAAAVEARADRIVTFDGTGWDFAPEDVTFTQRRWILRRDATGIILAGGQSRRMGRDKALLPFQGEPLLARIARQIRPVFRQLIVGANDPVRYATDGADVVPDERPGLGPLMGILSGLAHSRHDLNFVVGCDIPTVDLGFLLQLMQACDGCDAVIPLSPDGRPEPLFAVYRKSVAPAARAVLDQGGRRVMDLAAHCRVRHVPMPDADWYRNLNTPDDVTAAAMNERPAGRTI